MKRVLMIALLNNFMNSLIFSSESKGSIISKIVIIICVILMVIFVDNEKK